jgi:hypothetical protein
VHRVHRAWAGWRSPRRRRWRRSSAAARPTPSARTRAHGRDLRRALARFTIPALDFAGSPVGIDARLVVELASARRSPPGCCTRPRARADRRGRSPIQPLAALPRRDWRRCVDGARR